jgi:hypothetical protein
MMKFLHVTFWRPRNGIILWGGTKESIKTLHILKKVIRLITVVKNMNPADRNLRKIEFLQ